MAKARVLGFLPYNFNTETFELILVTSGFPYYMYIFNICCLNVISTNFVHEQIPGGYFMQLSFVMGYLFVYYL